MASAVLAWPGNLCNHRETLGKEGRVDVQTDDTERLNHIT